MTLITETVTINSKNYKHIYSDAGYYVKRNDNKLFMDVLEPTSSTYTYTETTQLATQQLLSRMMARMSTLETKHNNLEGLPHVVETYSNGTDWYRVYSDGWCIQGSCNKLPQTGNWASTTVTLIKAYKDTNYNIITLGNWSDAGASSCVVTAKTTNSFTVTYAANNTTQLGVWQCTGYVK